MAFPPHTAMLSGFTRTLDRDRLKLRRINNGVQPTKQTCQITAMEFIT